MILSSKINAMLGEKIFNAFFCAACFALTIFFFAPLQVYLTNRLEFPFPLPLVFSYFIVISLIFIGLITFGLIILRFSSHKKAIAAFFILAILLWLQGNILVWNYGIFDGREINWTRYIYLGLIDTSIWIACVIIGMAQSSFINKNIRKVSAGLILIQFISIVFFAAQASELPSYEKYDFTTANLHNFSSKKNVIILAFDGFRTDFFQEIIDEEVFYKDFFNGFTYFRNATGGFPVTFPSVSLILTGNYYDNSMPVQDFIKKEFSLHSLPKTLKNHGFITELYPFVCSYGIEYNSQIFSNLKRKAKHELSFGKDIALIYDIALFRYTPHFIKKYIYHGQEWFLRRIFFRTRNAIRGSSDREAMPSLNVLENHWDYKYLKMTDPVVMNSDKNLFKYIHLNGMHPPLLFNEQLTCERLPFDRKGYKKQAKGILKLLGLFFAKLQEKGVYNDSMIFVIADHGLLDGNTLYISEDIAIKFNQHSHSLTGAKDKRALPLILVKRFKEKGEMRISDAPVSLSDIPKTVCSELGLEDDFPGVSMFAIKESDVRERRYLNFFWKEGYFKNNYLPIMHEYLISGFSWFEQSRRATGRQLIPAKQIIYQPSSIWNRIKKLIMEQ